MKTTHKAKDLNGNWVDGWYYFFDHIHYLRCVNNKGFHEDYRINPSTLCERVRGTDFFENDIVTDGQDKYIITWIRSGWYAKINNSYHSLSDYTFISTGKNRHDESK